MKLSALVSRLKTPIHILAGANLIPQIEIVDLAIDSRLVKQNSAFFALDGNKNNGTDFAFDAALRGAKAIILPEKTEFNLAEFCQKFPQIVLFAAENFSVLVEFLGFFYQPQPSNIYGITGTNGKTSVAEYTRQILQILDYNSASIGTLGVNSNLPASSQLIGSGLTTPDIISLHKNLHFLKQNSVDDVAIEVSSIGLHQQRIAGLKIAVGAFTNFSQDHLDYHGDMASYFAAKMLLFERVLERNSTAVLNSDISEFLAIKKICNQNSLRIIDYGRFATVLRLISFENQRLKFAFGGEIFELELSMGGEFSAYNMLCALGNVIASHNLAVSEIKAILPKLAAISSAAGRMQKIGELSNGAKIFIDFAHTADAIANVLKAAKQVSQGRVLILFGCGGNRDTKKRPIMAKIACSLADLVFVTDDNPRDEDPATIRREIMQNCDLAKAQEIPDRQLAILAAISMLRPYDTLILAGKGHEKYQVIGLEKFPFDEEKIVADALSKQS